MVEYKEIIARADQLTDKHKYEAARDVLQEGIEAVNVEGDTKAAKKITKALDKCIEEWAEDVNCLGDQLYKKKSYKEAITYYKRSIEIISGTDNESRLANYQKELNSATEKYAQEINDQGDRLLKVQQFEEAAEIYKKSIELAELAGADRKVKNFTKELHDAYTGLAERFLKAGDDALGRKDWEAASTEFEKALEHAELAEDEKLVSKCQKAQAKVYEEWAEEVNEKGDALFKAKKYEEALPLYSRSIELAQESGNEKLVEEFTKELYKTYEEQAEVINNIADEAMKNKVYDKAIEIYQWSIEIAQKSNNDKLIANYEKELNKAFEELAQQVNDKGDAAYKAKKWDDAVKLYERSITLAEKSDKGRLVKNFQKELASAYEGWAQEIQDKADAEQKQGHWEPAIEIYQDALGKWDAAENEKRAGKARDAIKAAYSDWAGQFYDQGRSFRKDKKYEQAVEKLERAIELAEMAEDSRLVGRAQKERDKSLRKMR